MTTLRDERSAAPDPAVRCRIGAARVSRSFGTVRANVDVDLAVRPGSIHAVIGENGAGKSTLMRMLYGLDRPDEGHVVIDDEPATLSSPRAAIERGIGLVQQELAIVPELTLLENLILGKEPRRAGRIDWRAARASASRLASEVDVEIDWDAPASGVSIAIQQQVEILRLIHRGADVLILDEPTAVLAPAQARELLKLLASLRDAGRTVIFISHKLDEVLAIAEEVTVLRGGRSIARHARDELDRESLAALIIGDSTVATEPATRGTPGDARLVVADLRAKDDRGFERLAGVSFEVRAGEIVGIAAVAGNGQEELAEALIGVRPVSGGDFLVDGRSLSGLGTRKLRQQGVAYVSADRKHEGLALALSLSDNVIAGPMLSSLATGGWLRPQRVREHVAEVLRMAEVKFGTTADPASSLSGGNQQRVVIGRETIGQPSVLIASQPSRGVDIRGIGYIHQLLRRSRDEGAAILLLSEELDELQELSARIVVMHRGKVSGIVTAGASRAEIGALMLGDEAEDAV